MSNTIRITRDVGLTFAVVGKLVCDCGWYEKFYEKEIIKMAKAHLRSEHGGGTIICGDNEMEVKTIAEIQVSDTNGREDRNTHNGARKGASGGVSDVPTRGWNPVFVSPKPHLAGRRTRR